MSMAVGKAGGAKADINMTPMIDVLLGLFIIFIGCTPLTPKGLEALVPKPPRADQPQSQADQRTVVIVINRDKSMMTNQEATDEQRLGPRLEEIFKTRAERVVFVKGDNDLEYQYVAKAIDIAHGAGIDKVGLMTPKVE